MSFTKLLSAGVAALAFGAVLTAGPALAEPLTPTPVIAPGEPAPGGTSSGSALTNVFEQLLRTLRCGSAAVCV
ncbi:hypothetical protein [Nocardia lijiangensis]|uniref:hypothetical protein n=1 Tax=Nocardia lijiangensis TaxID=299618 RepID=UPI0012DEB61E|nr:hypothetical protein [Nocardia lijiangensis]